MGRTRKKSSHNQGRKPLYKEHRQHLIPDRPLSDFAQRILVEQPAREETTDSVLLCAIGKRLMFRDAERHWERPSTVPQDATAETILSHPAYMDGLLLNRNLNWSNTEIDKLKILATAPADIARTEIALGRPIKAIAWRARDMGLQMPAEWAALVRPKYRPRIRMEPLLHFPYIKKARPEHADILRANALVPRGFSEDVRADICQSMMLALYEGTVTLDELEANKSSMRYFIGKFYKDQRPHEEVQIPAFDDAEPTYDTLARLHDEHEEDKRSELRRIAAGYMDHQPATQVEDIYKQEMAITSGIGAVAGIVLEHRDVRLLVETGDWHEKIGTFATHRNKNHAVERAKERFGLEISYRDLREISDFCRRAKPAYSSYGSDVHYLKVRGERVKVAVYAETKNVMSFIPIDKKYYGPDGLPLND